MTDIQWKPIKSVNWIVVHCADTKPSMTKVDVNEIRKWHKAQGWSDVGYHYVITRNGTIQKGRAENIPGAHVRGLNEVSLGVCMAGGMNEDGTTASDGLKNFTIQQQRSLEALVKELVHRYPKANVIGHRDVPGVAKACPTFDVIPWWAGVAK